MQLSDLGLPVGVDLEVGLRPRDGLLELVGLGVIRSHGLGAVGERTTVSLFLSVFAFVLFLLFFSIFSQSFLCTAWAVDRRSCLWPMRLP